MEKVGWYGSSAPARVFKTREHHLSDVDTPNSYTSQSDGGKLHKTSSETLENYGNQKMLEIFLLVMKTKLNHVFSDIYDIQN